ncbi:MAG: hypothetical protein RLZ77_753 [Bacteroidota bacterium]
MLSVLLKPTTDNRQQTTQTIRKFVAKKEFRLKDNG